MSLSQCFGPEAFPAFFGRKPSFLRIKHLNSFTATFYDVSFHNPYLKKKQLSDIVKFQIGELEMAGNV